MAIQYAQRLLGNDIFTIPGLLSPEECADMIDDSERRGFHPATVHTAAGHQRMQALRNNARLTLDDVGLATWLWSRLRPCIPQRIDRDEPAGVNPRLRFYRYTRGQRFDWHTDGHYRAADGLTSRFTFLIYLNNDYTGGATEFAVTAASSDEATLRVEPATGMGLLFRHGLTHRGGKVVSGCKYALRTDVMCTPCTPM